MVYLGFIAVFLTFNHAALWEQLPSTQDNASRKWMPDRSTFDVPLLSFFAMCPALFVWRRFTKVGPLIDTKRPDGPH